MEENKIKIIEKLKKLFNEILKIDNEIFIINKENDFVVEIVNLDYNELKLMIDNFKKDFNIMKKISKFVDENNINIFSYIPINVQKENIFYFNEIDNVYFYLGEGAKYVDDLCPSHLILSIQKLKDGQ